MLAKDFEPMKLEEVIQAIEAAKVKRDFMYELTPANKQILSRRNGTFEGKRPLLRKVA